MAIDLDTLSPKELDALISKARKRKTILKKRKPIATVRARLKAAAAAEGYTIEEVFGIAAGAGAQRAAKAPRAARTGGSGAKVPPKYRNPANAEQTWTGRGRQPRWMAEEVAKGRKPEDFLIAKD